MKICPVCRYCYEDAETACAREGSVLLPSRPGSRLIADKYRLDRLLGRGGMGAVYAGAHVELERPAAIKLLLPDLVSDTQALERFRREARAAARLNHPNVADTYDYGLLEGGEAYIVMELVEGLTLRERMDEAGALPFEEAAAIARQVADGIEAAHRGGIVHRDLKPSNIILTRDHHDSLLAKVLDFGIAKLKEHTTTGGALTNTGSLVGTPRYMSPEQCSGSEIDARSDLYSLGVILYEMLAGRPPFDAPSATAIALKHVQAPPPPLADFRPDVPDALAALVTQSLAKEPDARPQTAAEFSRGLRAAEESLRLAAPVEAAAGESRGAHAAHSASPVRPADAPPQSLAPETGRTGEPTNEDSGGLADFSIATVVEQDAARPDPPALLPEASAPVPDAPSPDTSVTSAARPLISDGRAAREAPPRTQQQPAAEPPAPAPERDGRASSQPAPLADQARRTDAKKSRLPLVLGAIAVAFLVGLGALFLLRPGDTTPRANSNAARQPAAPAGTPAPLPGRADVPAATASPVAPPAEGSAEAPEGERRALRAALDDWVAATNARDISRQMNFYAPRLATYYLNRDVTSAAVRAEKESVFGQATRVEVSVSEPVITFGRDGRTAVLRFRKQYLIESDRGRRSGEVLEELGWTKTGGVWKITSERDPQVLR